MCPWLPLQALRAEGGAPSGLPACNAFWPPLSPYRQQRCRADPAHVPAAAPTCAVGMHTAGLAARWLQHDGTISRLCCVDAPCRRPRPLRARVCCTLRCQSALQRNSSHDSQHVYMYRPLVVGYHPRGRQPELKSPTPWAYDPPERVYDMLLVSMACLLCCAHQHAAGPLHALLLHMYRLHIVTVTS